MMRRSRRAAAMLPCLVAFLALTPAQGCGSGSHPAAGSTPAPQGVAPSAASAAVPASASAAAPAADSFAARFSAEGAWKHLSAQIAMGPRAHGLPGHAKAQEYIRAHLRACGANVNDMEFTFKSSRDPEPVPFTNIIARFPGASDRWVLIGTHYDTRLWADVDPDPSRHEEPIQGANDGGSGTAVLLEIASVLKDRKPPIGIELVFFDGEDYGRPRSSDYFVGSGAMAKSWSRYHPSKPAAAVIIDMVGDADLQFVRESNSDERNSWLNDALWQAGSAIEPRAFGPGQRPVWDDHTALLELGIPSTLLIDFDYPWWHTVGDTIDKCAPGSLGITGQTLLSALVDRPLK